MSAARPRSAAGGLIASAPAICTLAAVLFSGVAAAQAQQSASPVSAPIPHRYLVAFRDNAIPTNAQARLASAAPGVRILRVHPTSGVAVIQTDPVFNEEATLAALRAQPGVELVVHDRIVTGDRLILASAVPALIGVATSVGTSPGNGAGTSNSTQTPTPPAPYDTYYTSSPQNWAVLRAGGYGANVPGGPAQGPWNITQGKGVRIAVLDSGVDAKHPDIAPNLIFNLSEIDQSLYTGLPSPCDDATPQDQTGHGTWTSSLAAAAMGPGTGLTVGVAPAASILNIKVLERLPDPSSTSPSLATQCSTGQPSGYLSWVVEGIDDAVNQHADIISLSLGALIDLTTGEGAGLKTIFDRVTYAATQAGTIIVAAAGNDGVDLSNPQYIELPAQSRGVVAVVASTNPACAENLAASAACVPGPVTLPYYSNHGLPLNAIAAPGGSLPTGPNLLSDTAPSGFIRGACSSGLPNTTDGLPTDSTHSSGCFSLGHVQYVQAMGTSASTPLAAGAAALLRAAHPTWTATQIVTALRAASVPSSSLPAAPLLDPFTLTQQLSLP